MNKWIMTTVTFSSTDNKKAKNAYEKALSLVDDEGFIRFCNNSPMVKIAGYEAELESIDDDSNSLELYSLYDWPEVGLQKLSETVPDVKINILVIGGHKTSWRRGRKGYIKNGISSIDWIYSEEEMNQKFGVLY